MADKPEVIEGEKKLTIQLQIPNDKISEALDQGVHNAMFQGAVNYVLAQITPEVTEKLVMKVLEEAFKGFSSWQLTERLKKEMTPMLDEVLRRPEVLVVIRKRVEEGVTLAVAALPEKVKETLIERAVTGMTKAWREDH